jgi:hypothetical protein
MEIEEMIYGRTHTNLDQSGLRVYKGLLSVGGGEGEKNSTKETQELKIKQSKNKQGAGARGARAGAGVAKGAVV